MVSVEESAKYLDAQYAVLGSILIEPKLMGKCVLAVNDSDFDAQPCRLCWQVMRRLWSDGQPADPVLVSSELAPLMGSDQARSFVVQLMEITPTAANIDSYLRKVTQMAAVTRIRDIASQMLTADTMDELRTLIAKASTAAAAKQARRRMNAQQMLESFAEDHAKEQSPKYLPWSMGKLRDKMDVEAGDLVYIAGRPSDGKTALALQEAWHQAKTERVGIYSYETSDKKLRDRSMANQIFVDRDRIKHNRLTDEDWGRFGMFSGELSSRNIEIIEASGMTVEEIQADAVARNFTVIYIDYLQLIPPSNNDSRSNRTNDVTSISMRLKNLGRQTGITTCVICSLSRNSIENGKVRRPCNADLRESGQLEYDADAIIFVWREDPNDPSAPRNIFVSKNKEGETGEFTTYFDGKHQLFTDRDDIPAPPPPYQQTNFQKITQADDRLPF